MIEHLIKAATCRVSCGDISGTGWLIGNSRVITARHCVLAKIENGQSIELYFPNTDAIGIVAEIVDHSEDWDACLLSLEAPSGTEPLPVSLELPRAGETWQTFGYPQGKTTLGHRLTGAVAQVLEPPLLKIDLDLSIDSNVVLRDNRGMSGAVVVCEGVAVGMIRLKVDGALAALSLKQLKSFLVDNDLELPKRSEAPLAPFLADRGDFLKDFEQSVQSGAGSYLFLEGGPGYGKTTFCKNFRATGSNLINLGAYCLADPDNALAATYRAQPKVFFDWLSVRISGLIIGQPPRKGEKGYTELILQTANYLNDFSEYCAQRGRVGTLFVDGLNEIADAGILSKLLGLLPAKLPFNITIVLVAPNFANLAGLLAGRVNEAGVFVLPPLSYDACSRFCQQALISERRSLAVVGRICERAKGHPLYLRYLIEYSNHQLIDDNLNDFPMLAGRIEEYYQVIWAKLLPDGDAVYVLALMARLRSGISLSEFSKVLNPSEHSQYTSVISRIRHLLSEKESTGIYHASFATFIIQHTTDINDLIYRRLAKFCLDEPEIHYCVLNRVFHLTHANDNATFTECNQAWFDAVVTLGVAPDTLIADVDAVVRRAAVGATPDEFFRLLLLAQRITFRYDTLFSQSARLIAEALIALGRPSEALQHVLRLNTLIVGPREALEISFLLHHYGYNADALTLLHRLQQRLVESYDSPMHLEEFLRLCSWHIRTILFVQLADGWNGMKQINTVLTLAQKSCDDASPEPYSVLVDALHSLQAEPMSYFLTFCDDYADLYRLKMYMIEHGLEETEPPLQYLHHHCHALLQFETAVDHYNLPKGRKSFSKLFADLAQLIPTAEMNPSLACIVSDTLVRFGASASVVELFDAKSDKQPPAPLQIKAENGVDIDLIGLQECLYRWRVAAFLDANFRGPSAGIIAGTGWLESFEHLIGNLYCCDGRARRAKADSDEGALIACRSQLQAQVIKPLRFTLQERADWSDSYAVPENVLPWVYRQLAELFSDCFPEELPDWLDSLVLGADGQWGMYSEGFRASAFQILQQLTREKYSYELDSKLLGLLHTWRDHVLRGVENRHELVPEILRMIPIFTRLGAKEEAERLYHRMLAVSMGPTWYKEDQLGIMTAVLDNIAVNHQVELRLPQIAGYLERASGEMTFQRYVRTEKSILIGQIARMGKFHLAFAYFRRQCCGSTSQLWAEAQQGLIDKVGPLRGNRFPGGALDDQAAALALVRNSGSVSWALRWAVLEIFHCGDQRHLSDYAEAFALIANEVGELPALVRRAELVINAETSVDDRPSFLTSFKNALNPEIHAAFSAIFADLQPPDPPFPFEHMSQEESDDDKDDTFPGLYQAGVFGHQKALREAGKILENAERQLTMGNYKAAKLQAVKVLQIAQDGGWGIWGNLSESANRAEAILVLVEESAGNVIRYYAPLIEAEIYAAKWVCAQHLIEKVGPLLKDMENQRLLDAVIEHVRLLIGDAEQEIHNFDFLTDDALELNPDIEFFRFIVWLCNHPLWLRRDRAAAMLLWLIELIPELFSEAVTTAFSMDEGYGPDVLCGVLDGASVREPLVMWDKISGVLDLTKITQELRHVSRMVVLERLAARANKVGSPSAKTAVSKINATFNGNDSVTGEATLPLWADILKPEWHQIVRLCDFGSVSAWESELEKLCFPLSVRDTLLLEQEISNSFQENHLRPLNRWESKLRHALNMALWTRLSNDGARVVEAALRCYNPSQPERSVTGMSNSFTDQLLSAIECDDYSTVFGSKETVVLNYHEMVVKPTGGGTIHLEVLCLLQPAVGLWGQFNPQSHPSFYSSELPQASVFRSPFETCCRLKPEVVYFDPFTPAAPMVFFQNLASVKANDFVRQNWRYGRRNGVHGFGQPERSGCSLYIQRTALSVPAQLKVAWLVWLDGELVAFVDEHNNRMG